MSVGRDDFDLEKEDDFERDPLERTSIGRKEMRRPRISIFETLRVSDGIIIGMPHRRMLPLMKTILVGITSAFLLLSSRVVEGRGRLLSS